MKPVDDSAPTADAGPLAGAATSRPPETPPAPHPRFDRHPVWRLILVFGSAGVLSLAGCVLMVDFLWRLGFNGARLLLFGLFCILFTMLCLGFIHALVGFLLMFPRERRGGSPPPEAPPSKKSIPTTALVFVVYNENVARVFAGLRAIYRSIEREGQLGSFEFFVLSDTRSPDRWVEEEMAWVHLCREVGGFGRIFYRHRRDNVNKKSGNIADFCRTWGGRYTYMIVCDADSVMAGADIVRMTRLMEANPRIGILQTAPRIFGGESLWGRIQQFSNGLYGRMFCAGLDFWQCGVGNYWGHNAVIRLEPFIEYCDLPDLPGIEPFGGKILSHDFVEAALMRKAGWEVWLLYELEGSWEEGPQSLIESAKRDRRWCQGNLQHTWLLFSKGLHPANKVHLLMGILGYLASPLWLMFLALSTWVAIDHNWSGLTTILPAQGFVGEFVHLSLLEHGLLVFFITLVLLLGPKLLAWLLLAANPARARLFGGLFRTAIGIAIEFVFSTLVAPVLMLFHSRFILFMFLGRSVEWKAQKRGAGEGTGWVEAIAAHGGQTLLAVAWAALAWETSRTLFWWLSPVLLGLLVSIPFSVITSLPAPGQWLRRMGVLLTPAQSSPAPELVELDHALANVPPPLPSPADPAFAGLTAAVIDPYVNGVHVSLQEASGADHDENLQALADRLVQEGAAGLTDEEVRTLLSDPQVMITMHRKIWASAFRDVAPHWRRAVDAYRRPIAA